MIQIWALQPRRENGMNKTGNAALSLKAGDTIQGMVVEIFAATRNDDRAEGRGPRIAHSYHLTKRDAAIGASGIDVGGHDGKVESRLAIRTISGTYYLCPLAVFLSKNEEAAARLREEALAKLTSAERAALIGV